MLQSERSYLPAAGHDWFLPIYDPLTRLLGVDTARRELLEQAALDPHHQVLDVGCGTGALAILIKHVHPGVDVAGVDPDPKALARAQRKASRAGVSIRFDRGFADALPYGEGTFDRVFSSMMLHHVADGEKEAALREVHRVLKAGGRLELLDFFVPESGDGGFFERLIHSHHQLKDNTAARVLSLLSSAGFAAPKMLRERRTLFGRIGFYQAVRTA
jgi:ubiquinone/menaquinone biosynthesis C-methylase UbiE